MAVIVVSGQSGTGSTTVSRMLAKELKLRYFSPGEFYKGRGKGKETERAIGVWSKLAKTSSAEKFHKNLDRVQRNFAESGDAVICGKISIRMLRGLCDFSVWLRASKAVRAKRYAKRDGTTYGQAVEQLKEKEKLERSGWKRIYGFDYFEQEKEADMIINAADKTPRQIVRMIVEELRARGLTE